MGVRRSAPAPRRGGLTAAELGKVLEELREVLTGAEVLDTARLGASDDLLLFFHTTDGRRTLQIAPGGSRARICTTRRRFPRDLFATGPQVDRLRKRLTGMRLVDATQPAGERCCTLLFRGARPEVEVALAVELFGPRGLWCLLDADHRVVELSRVPRSTRRSLRPGERYEPPPPRGSAPPDRSDFAPPFLEAVDTFFTERDLSDELSSLRRRLQAILDRPLRKLTGRIAGLIRQQEQIEKAPAIRLAADMLLACASRVRKGDTELVVAHPDRPSEQLHIPLDPARTAPAQAQTLYRRARKLEDATEVSARRLEEARVELDALESFSRRLAASRDEDLASLESDLARSGHRSTAPSAPAKPPARLKKITKGENFRRFTSAEGHLIMVGRTNEQNDRLTLRVARGNDLWFHVGQGRAGSHVVVRVPRAKTASLETMLDAGTLAIHYSKARGVPRCDVVYTHAKHVRKPKGLPPGRVVPAQTKTLTVRLDEQRLHRLLSTTDS